MSEKDKNKKRSNLELFLFDLVLGGSAGAISKTAAPLERVKLLI